MKTRVLALTVVAVAALIVGVSVVVAQPGGGGNRGGMGQGGRGMMGNMAFGTVTDGNITEGWIKVSMGGGRGGPGGGPGGGGADRTVTLNKETALVTVAQAALADLKEGNGLMVNGIPTSLIGGRFVTGENSNAVVEAMNLLGGGGMGFRGGPGARGGTGDAAGGQGGVQIPPSTATATGLITSLDPIKIRISDQVTVEIKPSDDATYLQIVAVAWDKLAQDDRVFCMGQGLDDGGLLANTVVILPADLPMGFGMGGPGGPGGGRGGPGGAGGGPGGPGGAGGGPGGPGGQ
jgi:hypothetical protein